MFTQDRQHKIAKKLHGQNNKIGKSGGSRQSALNLLGRLKSQAGGGKPAFSPENEQLKTNVGPSFPTRQKIIMR